MTLINHPKWDQFETIMNYMASSIVMDLQVSADEVQLMQYMLERVGISGVSEQQVKQHLDLKLQEHITGLGGLENAQKIADKYTTYGQSQTDGSQKDLTGHAKWGQFETLLGFMIEGVLMDGDVSHDEVMMMVFLLNKLGVEASPIAVEAFLEGELREQEQQQTAQKEAMLKEFAEGSWRWKHAHGQLSNEPARQM